MEIVNVQMDRSTLCYTGAVDGMLGARLKSWMEAQLGRAKKRKQKQARPAAATTTTGPLPPPHLSSPESAYSTGYSTDGTSPGAPPAPLAAPLVAPPPPPAPPTTHLYHEPAKVCLRLPIKYFLIAVRLRLHILQKWEFKQYGKQYGYPYNLLVIILRRNELLENGLVVIMPRLPL